MDEIRSWWEVPCVAHFCKIFSKPFKLPDYEIEELEDALLLDMNPDPSSLLVQLYVVFLNGIVDRDITEENWQSFLKLHVKWRCDFLNEKWNPFHSKQCEYAGLSARDKVELLHKLCHWRLELDDVGDLVRGYDGPSLRLTPVGKDSDGYLYWFFYGTRLYREAPTRKPQRRKKADCASGSVRGKGRHQSPGKRKVGANREKKTEVNLQRRASGRGRGGGCKKTPSRRRKRAEVCDDSSANESEQEGQSTSRSRRGHGLSHRQVHLKNSVDDEGYEGSGEEVVVRRGRWRARRGEVKLEQASTETPAEEKEAAATSEGGAVCNGRAVESEETMEMSPRPGDHVKEDEVSMETINKPSPDTGNVKSEEEQSEERTCESVRSEGEDVKGEDVKGEERKSEVVTMDTSMSALAGNSNNNSNKRSGDEEGEEEGSAGEGEKKIENRRRSLRSQNKGRDSSKPTGSEPQDKSPEVEERDSSEKEEGEGSDTNDWEPGSSRGRNRGRGRSSVGRSRVRKMEESEEESEVEEEEEKEVEKEVTADDKRSVKWQIICSTEEEWDDLMDTLSSVKTPTVRKLSRALEELVPHVQWLFREREKEMKRKLIAELPRRMSDRIALKAQKEEQEKLDAQLREQQREVLRQEKEEEMRRKEDEAEEKRQRRREEAIRRKKAREAEQTKVREEEEKNWQQAMSGELSGPRRAALGAAEGVSEVIKVVEGEGGLEALGIEEDKEEYLYTAFYKILSGLRRQEDSWVFEDPVTESIAPGYHQQISIPMDYSTVESRLEKKHYTTREEFETDIKLIFTNCIEYNGDDSEYSELANQMLEQFQKLCKFHLEGGDVKEEDSTNRKSSRLSRSPSVCKTPELTSESSSEEASGGDSDESYSEGGVKPKKTKSSSKPLYLTPKLSQLPPSSHLPPRPPQFQPHPSQHPYYQHMMQYRMRYEMSQQHISPEMMHRAQQQYGRLPPPPYSPHHHMPRPPPDHPYPPYPPHYPSHYPPASYQHSPHYRQPFPPHMMGPQHMHHPHSPQPHQPHHSPSRSPGMHGRPGSVPPGSNSIPPGQSPTAMEPVPPRPGSVPSHPSPGSVPPPVGDKDDSTVEEKEKEEAVANGADKTETEEDGQKTTGEKEESALRMDTASPHGAMAKQAHRPHPMATPSQRPHPMATHSQGQHPQGPHPMAMPPNRPHPMTTQQQAVYRYQQQQMMRATRGYPAPAHDPYHHLTPHYNPPYPPPHYPPPHHTHPRPASSQAHSTPHPPTSHSPYPPSPMPHQPPHPSQQEAYYAWQQHRAMYGREGRPGMAGSAGEDPRQYHYWMEMEKRRQYYAYMQQRAARDKAAHEERDQKISATEKEQDEKTDQSTDGNITEARDGSGDNKEKVLEEGERGEGGEEGGRGEGGEEGERGEGGEEERSTTSKASVSEAMETGPTRHAAGNNGETGASGDSGAPGDTGDSGAVGSTEEGDKSGAAAGDDGKEKERKVESPQMVARGSHRQPVPMKDMYRHYRPQYPYPAYPSHMQHSARIQNGYPGNELDPYHYPHMYAMPPPGYGMRPLHGSYRARPAAEKGDLPRQNPTAAPSTENAKSDDKQGIPLAERPAPGYEKGFPPGYSLPQYEGFPPGYGHRRQSEMDHRSWPPDTEHGFPLWHQPHGYPPPAASRTPDQREQWSAQMKHQMPVLHMHHPQYPQGVPHPQGMPTGHRSPSGHTPSHGTPHKRELEQPSHEDTAPPSKKGKDTAS